MSGQRLPRFAPRAARQRGQAMLLTVLLLAVGVSAIVYNFVRPARQSIDRNRITAAALAQAKEALIGRAAADQARPGSLPCPDIDNDGDAESPVAYGGVCPSYIGRFPWRTLGMVDLRDGSGERLWYALTPGFRDHPSGGVLNSDTPGQLTITGDSPAGSVIAILFAPGVLIGTQNRSDTVSSLCGTTGTTILNVLCPANYLEGENGNGVPPGDSTFTTALASGIFNDQLLAVTSDALFNVVNVRVAKEAIAALENYRGANGYYPFANAYGSAAPYDCSSGVNRGRFPITLTGCGQPAWGGTLPVWYSPNNWNLVTHYAMSKSCGQVGGLFEFLGLSTFLCGLAAAIPLLAPVLAFVGFTDDPVFVNGVTGANGARTLVIVTGRAQTGQTHPCGSVGQCLEDPLNTDGNAVYVKPSRFPASNDRIAVKCDSGSPCPIVP